MANPAQMYDHELNVVKGALIGQPWTVDKTLASGITSTSLNAGMAMYQSATTKQWVLGAAPVTGTSAPIQFFAFQNGTDYDVLGDSGNITGASLTTPGALAGRVVGISCAHHSELETTEYDTGTAEIDWVPGTLLIAMASGKITRYVSGAKVILGVCSDGLATSEHSRSLKLMRFHSVYVPKFS